MADLIADLNDFNNHAYNRLVEKIKVSHHGPKPPLVWFGSDTDRTRSILTVYWHLASKASGPTAFVI